MRRFLKVWTPPIIWDWLRCRFGGFRVVRSWPQNSIGGWPKAASEIEKGYTDGLRRMTDGPAISFLTKEEIAWEGYLKEQHDRLVQFALVVARTLLLLKRSEVRILDFGGALGLHMIALQRLIPGVQFCYTVCELPEIILLTKKNEQARFVSTLKEAGGGYHLVYASGSIQHQEDWRNLVADLCRASVANIFITRTPITFCMPTFVAVQSAYHTEYPCWVFNYDELVNEFLRHGMKLKELFVNGRGIPIDHPPNVHLGLLFERMADA